MGGDVAQREKFPLFQCVLFPIPTFSQHQAHKSSMLFAELRLGSSKKVFDLRISLSSLENDSVL